jgi:tetratricopeptide (TPR) repeat protein
MARAQISNSAAANAFYEDGLAHHQAGRLDLAREGYDRALAADERHFDALHMLGVHWIQRGQLELAADLIRKAISLRRNVPGAYGNLANVLNRLGLYREALEASDSAIALNPAFAEAHGNRAQALQQLARLDEALVSYDRVVALKPSATAHFNKATVLRDLRQFEEALASCNSALALKPDYVEALRSRGVVLGEMHRLQEGLGALDQACALRPDYADAWCSRGVLLSKLGRPSDALASYDQALALRPDHIEALCNRVTPLRELQQHEAALVAADAASAANPQSSQARNVRGVALYDLRRLEDAVDSYDQAIALEPDNAKAHGNRGMALYELRRLDEAMASYDRALELDPNLAYTHHNQGMCRLMLGQHDRGWAQYEWRWRTDELRGERLHADTPLWLGQESLAGRTILLWAEQGLGDTLQFCRYARDVAALGARVILEVQPGLEGLAARIPDVAEVVTCGQPAPPFDFQTPLMSLPHALLGRGPTSSDPYLSAPAEGVDAFAERMMASPGLRVGLCWAGGARPNQLLAHHIDLRRSLPLEAFAPLASVDGVAFYSLQKGPPVAQLGDLQAQGWSGPPITDLTSELGDWAATAAFVANLDLVITCDTSIAHLAGGMGKPVWILNRFDGCWRWLASGTDSPWYASARIFRQETPGSWEAVITEVVAALAELARPMG